MPIWLIAVAVVDNLAKKIDECPLNRDCICVQLGVRKVFVVLSTWGICYPGVSNVLKSMEKRLELSPNCPLCHGCLLC